MRPAIVALSGIFVWIPVAVITLMVIFTMIQGDMDFLLGSVALYAVFCLGYFAVNPPVPILSPIFCVSAYLTMVLMGWVRKKWTEFQLRRIDIGEIQKCLDVMRARGSNPVVEFKVATFLMQSGEPGVAMDIANRLQPQMSQSLYPEELRQIALWRQYGYMPEGRSLTCRKCSRRNLPGAIMCASCGDAVVKQLAGLIGGESVTALRLVGTWILLVVLITGITLVRSLPPALAVAVIGAIFICAVVALVRALRIVLA